MLDYCRETIDLDLSAYEKDSSAHLKFHSLLGQISSIAKKHMKDATRINVGKEEEITVKDTLRKEGVKVYELSDLVKENTGFRNYIQDKIESLYKKSRALKTPFLLILFHPS